MNLSLDKLAERWTNWSMGNRDDSTLRLRSNYNFKATAFNATTAALVVSVAWAILSPLNPYALLGIALAGLMRSAVLKNIERDLKQGEPEDAREAIKAQVFEFVAFLNWAPALEPSNDSAPQRERAASAASRQGFVKVDEGCDYPSSEEGE